MKQFLKHIGNALRSDRATRITVTALVVGVVIALNAVIYALTMVYGLYLYKDDSIDLSLSDAPEAALSRAEADGEQVTVLFCQSMEDVKRNATGAPVYETARQMAERFPSLIKLEFVNVVIHPERVEKYRDEENGKYVSSSSVIFIHGENYRIYTTVGSSAGYADFYTVDASTGSIVAYNGEEAMTAGILWVLQDEHKKVYLTKGHSETATLTLTTLLGFAGYTVETIDLHNTEVPSDAEMVIISNPVQDFEKAGSVAVRAELVRLQSYMDRGGTVMAMLDPYLKTDLSNLKAFLAQYGITVTTVQTEDGAQTVGTVRDTTGGVSIDGMSVTSEIGTGKVGSALSDTVRKFTDGAIKMSWTAALSIDASKGAEALLLSSPTATLEAGGKTVDREGSYALIGYGERERDGETSRVVVIPSIYLTESSAMISNAYANRDFLYALLDTMDEDAQTMPYHCRMSIVTQTALENLTVGTARLFLALTLLLPVALAVTGTVVLLRRKYR